LRVTFVPTGPARPGAARGRSARVSASGGQPERVCTTCTHSLATGGAASMHAHPTQHQVAHGIGTRRMYLVAINFHKTIADMHHSAVLGGAGQERRHSVKLGRLHTHGAMQISRAVRRALHQRRATRQVRAGGMPGRRARRRRFPRSPALPAARSFFSASAASRRPAWSPRRPRAAASLRWQAPSQHSSQTWRPTSRQLHSAQQRWGVAKEDTGTSRASI